MLVIAFFVTAVLYASVGFGGGSTYNALLILTNIDYTLIPVIALFCNLIVVSGNSIRYYQNQLIPWKFTLPVILISIPFAWLGGKTIINKDLFILILAWTLLISGLLMLLRQKEIVNPSKLLDSFIGKTSSLIVSAALGFLAGLVGVGGGIFFAPLLYLSKALPTKNIAAFASFFILVNSVSGLIGQFMKHNNAEVFLDVMGHGWLFIAVLIGGQIGSRLSIKKFKPIIIRRLTALLVIYVGCRLLLLA